MKYFIDESCVIYAYEDDGSQDELIGNKKMLTEKELDAILNPPPTHEEVIASAKLKKSELLTNAESTISIWQTKLLLNVISDKDKASLIAWLAYIDMLNTIDVSLAPNINWPAHPGQ
ncbi:hypothetical protein GTGU_04480 [Trabulsiella guamensis ATCC 49490]|uniref:Tail fiber assembly protein n=1 Tax=Trabulsiella guamensis ATCC 49490 TaxID=1005994 RepID=A0A084ZMA2_9ENTR|nr:tail fiber assembly protein [Trabulsiella guamensis]KFB98596.1 hypothetical protein GTGU_04480 [Trabulsiella guamensis ATCC 49490]